MKHLLVIADHQGGKNFALSRAISLQEKFNSKLTLLGFCYANIDHIEDSQLSKLSRNSLQKKLIAHRQFELEQVVSKIKTSLNKPALKITIKVQWSKHIAPAINAFCKESKIDMLCKSAQGTGHLLHTSTDWQLFRECPSPVMITATRSWKKKANILAAVDLATKTSAKQKLNHRIIQQAQQFSDALDADLHIAFALKVPQALFDLDIIDSKKYIKEKKAKFKASIDAFCEEYGIDKQHCHIKAGPAERVIPSIASKLKTNLVCCGTVGRKGIKGKLLGNTAEAILQKLRTDIIALKP